jgi:16S rRNA (adenine1518-N6/adenine1519-N6)-dimethyltransferase
MPVEVKDQGFMFRLIRASFNQRRKTLQNSLHNDAALNISKEDVAKALEQMELPVNVRGEKLTLDQFALLADLLQS